MLYPFELVPCYTQIEKRTGTKFLGTLFQNLRKNVLKMYPLYTLCTCVIQWWLLSYGICPLGLVVIMPGSHNWIIKYLHWDWLLLSYRMGWRGGGGGSCIEYSMSFYFGMVSLMPYFKLYYSIQQQYSLCSFLFQPVVSALGDILMSY